MPLVFRARRAPRTILAITIISAYFMAPAASFAVTTRYASPAGSGTACTQGSPCNVREALEGAGAGNMIDIRGDQGDYPIGSRIDAHIGISVRGSHGQPRLMFSSGALRLWNSTIGNVLIDVATGYDTAFALNDTSTANMVLVRAHGPGHACYLQDAVLTNSVCWADSASDLALETDGTNTLRNVTAYGGTYAAIKIFARGECNCATATDTLINVIASAGTGGHDLNVESDGSATAQVNVTYSNYRTTFLEGSGAPGKTLINADGTDQTSFATRPTFVDPAAGNFHPLATSKTRDHGVTQSANGTKDLDGLPRKAGTTTDIGAYEYSPPQTTINSGPSGNTTDRTPTFGFKSSRANSTFECSLDGAAYSACTSPVTTPMLGFGSHTFKVRATNVYADPSPATRHFKVVH